jgi:hypothetical protein
LKTLILILTSFMIRVSAAEFAVFDVYVDAGTEHLAAYQLKISDSHAAVKILSIEGGEHTSFSSAPKFDPKAIQRDVIKLAAFSLDPAEKLPLGRVRVASLHVEIGPGMKPDWKAITEAAGGPDGKKISAAVSVVQRKND